MLSEVLLLTAGGDVIAKKKYRHDISVDTAHAFFSKTQEKGNLLPHFEVSGVVYYHIKRQQIYVVATSCAKNQISPICVIELLTRMHHLLKDFCGSVTENSLHTNMVLVYEVLDELFDCGLPQLTSTDKIKPYIQSEPVIIKSPENKASGLFGMEHRLAPSDASNKPVIRTKWDQEQRKNEIFLDVIERMNIMISSDGTVSRSEVQGQVTMKSFLIGYPEIKIGLNEDLTVGNTDTKRGYGAMVHLDELSFHSCVKSEDFTETKLLTVQPPEGQFTLLNYSLHGDLPHGLPFRIYTYQDVKGSARDIDFGIKLRCEIPSHSSAINVSVILPVPAATTSISQRLTGPEQSAEFSASEKKIVWMVKKIYGRSEVSAHFTLIGARERRSSPSDLGPVALTFEVSGFVCSGLNIRFLRVFEREHSYVPTKWIRYITTADSYIYKI